VLFFIGSCNSGRPEAILELWKPARQIGGVLGAAAAATVVLDASASPSVELDRDGLYTAKHVISSVCREIHR
jgi:hypothetical protein